MAKVIDRLLLVLLCIVAVFSAGCIIAAVYNLIALSDSTAWLTSLYQDETTAVWVTIVCAVFILACLRLLYIAIRPGRVSQPSIDQRTSFGDIRISVDTVENLVLKAANRSRGVRDLKAKIAVNSSGLEIIIRAVVDGESPIPALTEEIQSSVKDFIEEITGIPVATVSVYVANVASGTRSFKSRVE